jgi:tetratricopeptide (TPR) repeat protein
MSSDFATGMLCLTPVLLFVLQYLFIDMQGMNLLAQHKMQMLLIQQHLGYNLASQAIQQQPFQVTMSTLQGRMVLLANQAALGMSMPLLSAWLLLGYLPLVGQTHAQSMEEEKRSRRIKIASAVGLVALGCLLMRGPLATLSAYKAKEALAAGDYSRASGWLDSARMLNPGIERVSAYHEERGQVWYFTHTGAQNLDSHMYLASVYRTQGDYLNAYQELLLAWQADHSVPWIRDALGLTVALMAENAPQKVKGTTLTSTDQEVAALVWLQQLAHVDDQNIYSLYYMGRIQYDKHDYEACMQQMNRILKLSNNPDVRSSAYTYLALSLKGEGRINEARHLLLKAIALDPYYHNNTAREELSGLH